MSNFQAFQPQDDTGRWIKNKAPEVDPAWNFDQAIKKIQLPQASPKLEERKKVFSKAISDYVAGDKNKDAHRIFRNATTWEAVRKEAEEALDKHANSGKSWRNPFRRTVRLVGGAASRLEFLTVLVPDGDYLGVLCGGLTLVYNAANRKKELRELIIVSLESLNVEISHTHTYIRAYSRNKDLLQKTEDLYIAILEAIEAIFRLIEKTHGFRSALSALVQQEDFGKDIEQQITTDVKTKVEAFERAVRSCLHLEVRNANENVVRVGETLNIVGGQIQDNNSELKKMVAAVSTLEDLIRDKVKDADTRDAALADRQRSFEERQREIQAFNEQWLNQLQQCEMTLLCAVANMQPQQPAPRQVVTVPQLLTVLNLVSTNQDLDITDQVIEKIRRERDFVLYFGQALAPRLQSCIATVIKDPQFDTWFKDFHSRALVINGMDLNAIQSDAVSPLSYLCTVLAQTVDKMQYAHPLAFFCRLHCDLDDQLHGAAGMMRSLVAQLVLYYADTHPDLLDFLAPPDLQTITLNNVTVLCTLFDDLVKRLGPGVVICMIDGINFFETELYMQDMNYVMSYLNSVLEAVERSQSGLVLKLLVTSPTASENCRYWFPNRVDLFMPRDILLDEQGFNELRLLMT